MVPQIRRRGKRHHMIRPDATQMMMPTEATIYKQAQNLLPNPG
jgi:hypothetical protein